MMEKKYLLMILWTCIAFLSTMYHLKKAVNNERGLYVQHNPKTPLAQRHQQQLFLLLNSSSSSLPAAAPPATPQARVSSGTWEARWVFLVHLSRDSARYEAIRATWAQAAGDLAIVFFGQDHYSLPQRDAMTMYVEEGDNDDNAFALTRRAVGMGLRTYPFADFLAKFDDDTYVYSLELIRQIRQQQSSAAGGYWGYPMKGSGEFVYASGGAGYVLSRRAAERVYECPQPPDTRYEDLAVGWCMRQAGIALTDLVGLHPHHPFQMLLWNKAGAPPDRVRPKEPIEGFMNPLTYHYVPPADMRAMHDPAYTYGSPATTTKARIPRILHQFWEGDIEAAPKIYMQKCRHAHTGWEHMVWNRRLIQERFPSTENAAGMLGYDGAHGRLVNQDFFDRRGAELNLLSDILRYEVLMLFGGVYVDADSECFRSMDFLIKEHGAKSQAIGFLEKDEAYLNGLAASGVICALHAYTPLSVALVSELQHTDWGKPPWISAGPMYYTQIIQQFKRSIGDRRLPPTLDVQILPSRHVYPYHHSDQRIGDQLSIALFDKGAVMDQKWGTTKQSYHHRSQAWSASVEVRGVSPWITDAAWRKHLHEYVTQVHDVGLSPLALHRPRWVIAAVHPHAGMCNRIMHVLSTLAFAMATGRVLLFDWDEILPQMHENGIEIMGHGRMEDVFRNPPPFAYSLRRALENFREMAQIPRRRIVHDDTAFLRALRFADLDAEYPDSVLVIERFDWWAPPMITHNPFYSESVFLNRSSAEVFSTLFRFLFSPPSNPGNGRACDWLLQRRGVWERQTAPVEAFLQCTTGAQEEKEVVVMVSDMIPSGPIAAKKNIEFEPVGCREGAQCDRATIESVYSLSGCKHAVLTHTSTFGACIAGLWQIADAYLVRPNGTCSKKQYVDPIEAGVLDGQDRQITTVLQLENEDMLRRPKCAFVYLMVEPTDSSVAELQRSIVELHAHFNHRHHYPIVLFVDGPAERWRYLQFVVSVRLYVVEVDPQQWAPAAMEKEGGPETFYLTKTAPQHQGFSRQYRRMSRYSAGFLLGHPALKRFDYVIKLDPDTHAYSAWADDPFMRMHRRRARIGFWISYSDMDDVTEKLWDTFADFMQKHGNPPLKQPQLLLGPGRRYLNTNLYGCFVGGRTAEFRSKEYAELFAHFDAAGGFMRYRWDEQKLLAFYAALYVEREEMEFFDYIFVEHQGWARLARRLD